MAKARVRFKALAKRLTGISTPCFGVSWNPPEDTRGVIRQFITFIEDRRVLFQPYHLEFGPWVNQSVLEIRQELTTTLKRYPPKDEVAGSLRAMRACCRKFLDQQTGPTKRIQNPYANEPSVWTSLGELRGVFGLHLARICLAFGLDVEPELASILPMADEK